MAFKRGTTLPEREVQKIECARAPCINSAQVRVKVRTGWANLCLDCYLRWIEQEMEDRWIAAGKPSATESMTRIREIAARPKPSPREHWERVLVDPTAPFESREHAREALGRMGGMKEREPGQDDEEITDASRFA